jgi:uncharacterized radical SAM protein YgiQ
VEKALRFAGNAISENVDVLLITGDAYVDHPTFGIAIIARHLQSYGLSVGILCPPFINENNLVAFGRPRLFVGVTAGNMDSMVSNYTASRKKRRTDDLGFSGLEHQRPDRATIVYTNLVKRVWKDVPIILGGIEASLRRFAHYDWWQDKVRHSVLLDSKADFIFYGMAERTLSSSLPLFSGRSWKENIASLPGVVYSVSDRNAVPATAIRLPSFEEVSNEKEFYSEAFRLFYEESDPIRGRPLFQSDGTRIVIQTPPSMPLDKSDLDSVYRYPYTRSVPDFFKKQGYAVKGLETVQNSITSHRGCYGACAFCAIGLHQGRIVTYRSQTSVIEEAIKISHTEGFKGYISDVGGPTANMYGFECLKKITSGSCIDRQCLYPEVCPTLKPDHTAYLRLLDEILALPKIKAVFISSGIRPDLVLSDRLHGKLFIDKLVQKHVSGHLKLAPEHANAYVLKQMRKYPVSIFTTFSDFFYRAAEKQQKKSYIIPYFMIAHPGESDTETANLKTFIESHLRFTPQQIQIFTPTPSTLSTTVYYTGFDPWTKEPVFSEKNLKVRTLRKELILNKIGGKMKTWQQ